MKVIGDKIKDKIKGCIFGQAIGDALGLGTEFMSAEEVKHHYPDGLRDYSQIIQDKHRRRFVRGRWTDDTDMMLCVLYGLENSSEINVKAVAANFKKWADGVPMGIGRHTYEVLSFWDYLQNPFKAAEIIWELSGREWNFNLVRCFLVMAGVPVILWHIDYWVNGIDGFMAYNIVTLLVARKFGIVISGLVAGTRLGGINKLGL